MDGAAAVEAQVEDAPQQNTDIRATVVVTVCTMDDSLTYIVNDYIPIFVISIVVTL